MLERIVLLALAAAAAAQYDGGGSDGCDLCSAGGGGSMGGSSRPTSIRLRYTGSNTGATNNRQGARGSRVRSPPLRPPCPLAVPVLIIGASMTSSLLRP